MKVELKKVNKPDGSHWFGIWVNNSCQIPAYHTLEEAQEAYDKTVENLKTPKPEYEIIKEEIISD